MPDCMYVWVVSSCVRAFAHAGVRACVRACLHAFLHYLNNGNCCTVYFKRGHGLTFDNTADCGCGAMGSFYYPNIYL